MRISDWSSDVCSSDLTLVLPPTCFFVLLLAALLLRRWSRRLGRWLLWSLLLVVYASTTPFVAIALIAPLQPYPPVDPLQPDDDVDAIVVLGAGIYYWAPEYRVPEDDPLSGLRAGRLTLQRLQYAAYIARPRSDERSVGKECLCTVRSWWAPYQ